MHNVNNEDGDVTESGATITEVGEGLVAGRVDDQQTRELQFAKLKEEGEKCNNEGHDFFCISL